MKAPFPLSLMGEGDSKIIDPGPQPVPEGKRTARLMADDSDRPPLSPDLFAQARKKRLIQDSRIPTQAAFEALPTGTQGVLLGWKRGR
ncbi:MAG: hypothetical protein ACRC8S_14585 [Fimbriiglobus sp.]